MTITTNFVFLIVSALGLASANGGISVKNLITQSASTEQSTNRGAVAISVGIRFGAISNGTRLLHHAARSII